MKSRPLERPRHCERAGGSPGDPFARFSLMIRSPGSGTLPEAVGGDSLAPRPKAPKGGWCDKPVWSLPPRIVEADQVLWK